MDSEGLTVTYLKPLEDGSSEEPCMQLRLVYQGELKASQRGPVGGQPIKNGIAEHKQQIRKVFHRQLKRFWETSPFLSQQTVPTRQAGIPLPEAQTQAERFGQRYARVPLVEAVAHSHRENNYRFVPLVRKNWNLHCSLDIMFLRHDPPGSVVTSGDLDNRIKTVIDALRKPENGQELRGNESPAEGEDPFYCLLEDDKLITGLTVKSDRFLEPPNSKKDFDMRQVHLLITVDVRPSEDTFNLTF